MGRSISARLYCLEAGPGEELVTTRVVSVAEAKTREGTARLPACSTNRSLLVIRDGRTVLAVYGSPSNDISVHYGADGVEVEAGLEPLAGINIFLEDDEVLVPVPATRLVYETTIVHSEDVALLAALPGVEEGAASILVCRVAPGTLTWKGYGVLARARAALLEHKGSIECEDPRYIVKKGERYTYTLPWPGLGTIVEARDPETAYTLAKTLLESMITAGRSHLCRLIIVKKPLLPIITDYNALDVANVSQTVKKIAVGDKRKHRRYGGEYIFTV